MQYKINGQVTVDAFSLVRPIRVAYLLLLTAIGMYVYDPYFFIFAFLLTCDITDK